jgi:hypothetical protein
MSDKNENENERDSLAALIELLDRTDDLIESRQLKVIIDRPPFDLDAHARRLKDPTLYYQPCPTDNWANNRNRR